MRQVRPEGRHAERRQVKVLPIVPVAVATIVLAACGGGGSGNGTGSSKADFREAALKHARCMREHGVNMSDPKFGPGGAMTQEMRGDGADKLKMQRAEEACRKYLDAVRPPELSKEQEQKFREEALRHARCMREHGIDFPDPQFGEGGTIRQKIGPGAGINPDDPRFQDAMKACAKVGGRGPGGGPMFQAGPG
jgi:hypothetical protein